VVSKSQYSEKMKVACTRAEEELIDFLNRCKLNNSEVMMFPKCNYVFDKEATKGLENYKPQSKKGGKWYEKKPNFTFNKSVVPYKTSPSTTSQQSYGRMKSFVPISKSLVENGSIIVDKMLVIKK